MNWSNIICIEVKKYNNQQLDVICEQLNLQPGTLAVFKESGSTLLYWEKDKSYVIGSVKKETLRDGFSKPLYKGLFLNSNYNHLSQKEKDRLLKQKQRSCWHVFVLVESMKICKKCGKLI